MVTNLAKRIGVGIVLLAAAAVAVAACQTPTPTPTATQVPTPTPTATPVPDVRFGMTAQSVMAPLEVGFYVESPSDDAVYSWEFGDGATATGASVSHTFLDAGQFETKLTADFNGTLRTANRPITVQPGVAGWIVVNSGAIELESGQSFQFEAEAYDDLGNVLDASTVEWSTDPDAGIIDGEGNFTAGQTIGDWEAGVVATLERAGVTVTETIPVSVIYGPPSELVIEPSEIDTRVTWEFDLSAKVLDNAGHELEDTVVTWEALRPGDSVTNAGEYFPGETVAEVGSALVVARYEGDDELLTQVVSGVVRPGILDEVTVSPELEPLEPGESVQLQVSGFDRFGNEVVLDRVAWTLNDDDLGTITPAGLLTVGSEARAFGAESLEVRGYKDGIESSKYVQIEVQAGSPVTMEFLNPSDSVPAGAASPLSVTVRDGFGNEVSDADVTFRVRGGGYLALSDVFVAGLDSGLYVDALSATLATPAESGDLIIEASTSVFVRERSADFIAIDVEDANGATVYLINLITAQLVPASRDFLNNDANESMPAWLPDGNRLLVSADIAGVNQIYVVDPFHNITHQVTDVPGGAIMAAPSPDGDQLAFVQSGNFAGGWDIVIAPLRFDESGAPVALITPDDLMTFSSDASMRNILPHWSPDGQWLMYTQVDSQGNTNAYIYSAEDPDSDRGFEIRSVSGLAWHPYGEEVLVTSSRLDDSGQVISTPLMLNLTTGQFRQLDTDGMGIAVASFSPDGTELAFVDESAGVLWLMDTDGTGLRQAVGAQFQTTITSWRPRALDLPTEDELIDPIPGESFSRSEVRESVAGGDLAVRIVTDSGTFTADLYEEIAPAAVANFVYLAVNGYYDGLAFHTVDTTAAYTGSITDGSGGMAGYYITSELNPNALHDRAGVLSMVAPRAGAVSSEFVISLQPNPRWDGFVDGQPRLCDTFGSDCYVVFGLITGGLDAIGDWQVISPFDGDIEPVRIVDMFVTVDGADITSVRQ